MRPERPRIDGDADQPRATYRLQLTPAFTFEDAAARVAYLAGLGVSHLYLSPITEAVPGSAHGYDVTDPGRLREELGGPAGFARLEAAAADHGLRLLVDVVPNHQAADPVHNRRWRDVLEDGERSPFAGWFDVDWQGPDPELRGRVMVPVLAEGAGAALATSGAVLTRDRGEVVLRVAGTDLPMGLESIAALIAAAAVDCRSHALAELAHDAAALAAGAGEAGRELRRAARLELHDRLARLCAAGERAASALDAQLTAVTCDVRRLEAVVAAQAWVLDGWRRGTRRLNHRRFFTIASLVAMRTEVPEAREPGLGCVLDLVRAGRLHGLRVDHVDGLRDPGGWLAWLGQVTGGGWCVVEKILAPGERLPPSWATAGTTGYELAALLVSLSVDPGGARRLAALRDQVAGPRPAFAETVRTAKLELLDGELASDWDRVRRRLHAVAERDPALGAHPAPEREAALRAILVGLGVYRTYVLDDGTASPADRAEIASAAARASARDTGLPGALLDLVAGHLSGAGRDPEGRCADLVAGVQQLSPALAAKAVEDTALYRDVALLARNEVGCAPDAPLAGPSELHAWCREAQARHPHGLLATSTHDTKRGEDVRARLCALSELASWWAPAVRAWAARAAGLDPGGDALTVLLQTLVGAWPIDAGRAGAYLVKAMREAGERTSWTDPDEGYENRLHGLVDGLLGDTCFVAQIEAAAERVAGLGERVSLAWTLLRLTVPGVPDTYQGSELWDLSLVDPDNRRPVDFDRRHRLLEPARTAAPEELLRRRVDGLPKLAVVVRALDLRRRRPELFGRCGAYHPLPVAGPLAGHCLAFGRGATPAAVTVVPRLPLATDAGWRGTAVSLPRGRWRNLLTGAGRPGGGEVPLDELLERFPVALLERTDAGPGAEASRP